MHIYIYIHTYIYIYIRIYIYICKFPELGVQVPLHNSSVSKWIFRNHHPASPALRWPSARFQGPSCRPGQLPSRSHDQTFGAFHKWEYPIYGWLMGNPCEMDFGGTPTFGNLDLGLEPVKRRENQLFPSCLCYFSP